MTIIECSYTGKKIERTWLKQNLEQPLLFHIEMVPFQKKQLELASLKEVEK